MNTQKMYKELCRHGRPGYPTLDEFQAKVNAITSTDPFPHLAEGRAMWAVMAEYGWQKGAVGSRQVRDDYDKMMCQQADVVEASKIIVASCDILEAQNEIPGLPPTAMPAMELEWVASHPAMLRYDMQRDKTMPVMVTREDILRAPNGQPPSRRAVNRLVHWVNRPNKFHEMLLTEDKKATHVREEGQSAVEAERDVSLHEIRELLAKLAK